MTSGHRNSLPGFGLPTRQFPPQNREKKSKRMSHSIERNIMNESPIGEQSYMNWTFLQICKLKVEYIRNGSGESNSLYIVVFLVVFMKRKSIIIILHHVDESCFNFCFVVDCGYRTMSICNAVQFITFVVDYSFGVCQHPIIVRLHNIE